MDTRVSIVDSTFSERSGERSEPVCVGDKIIATHTRTLGLIQTTNILLKNLS